MNLVNLIATGETFNDFATILKDLIQQMWKPCIGIASAMTILFALYLGWKFASTGGDEQKKKSAKAALTQFGIGILVIFVVAVGAPIVIGALVTWGGDNGLPVASVFPLLLT